MRLTMPKVTKTASAAMALDAVEAAGMYLPDKPKTEIPSLPPDVTVESDQGLMKVFREYVAWLDYVGTTLATFVNEATDAARYLERVKAQHLGTAVAETVTEAKAQAMLHPEVMNAQDDYDVADAKVETLKRMYEGLQKKSEFLSRELTRRMGRAPLENRDHKHGGG